MNVNPNLFLASQVLGVPVYPNVYVSKQPNETPPDNYITFNYIDERPDVYADDSDTEDKTTIAMHYFTKDDPQSKKKAVRKFLRSQGFVILSTSELYEQDTGYNHIAVEAYIYGIVNDE